MNSSALPWYLKGILYVALPAACLAALYLSIPGEVALARTAGWSEHYAPAMPICLSVYALSAGAIATYRRKMKLPGQVTALMGSLMALLLAMSAQSISHLIEQDYMQSSALLVVAVSCVPPLTIAHLIHMAETPSQVKTAEEEKEEMRETIDYLTSQLLEVAGSQLLALNSRIGATQEAAVVLEDYADSLTAEAAEMIVEVESMLREAVEPPTPTKAAPVAPEAVRRAAEALKAQGKKVTGRTLGLELGVAESTAYMYKRKYLTA